MTDTLIHSHERPVHNGRAPELGEARRDVGRLAPDTPVEDVSDPDGYMPRVLDRATVTRKRNRKGGTSAKVTGHLLPDARMRLALDRDADAILLADALGLYVHGADAPVIVSADRADAIGRKRMATVGNVAEAAYFDRWEIPGDDYSTAVDALRADGMTIAIPFRESYAEVTPSYVVSRKKWATMTEAEIAERDATFATDCPVARHTADLDAFHAGSYGTVEVRNGGEGYRHVSGYDRDDTSATRDRGRPEGKLAWQGRDGHRNVSRRGVRRGDVAETVDGVQRLYGPDTADGRVFVGHEARTVRVGKRQVQRRSWSVRAEVLAACAAVLDNRQSVTLDVYGVAVELAAATKRGEAPTAKTRQLFVAYTVNGVTGTCQTPAGAARAILGKVAAA